ncbi:dimethyladenosine transferase [Litorimonas taeanensis]|uniref:Ribosomal RNA small subunit methyltransferase A n=1 Tax=Litorimonas taeanensis TaxID=568099 RepID=A0A420WIN6_9PROT|nr:16S rRNA (adenine(1518)-N(6)/adenine(1519)-N(6))-dimethyltransferase RsmA [Litorimonas taeanensis]RKQ70785.1 dimethyladenosine transferase [Litorimonas taeanensis]
MENNAIHSLPSLTEVVREYNLGANKKLGQHFLLDMNLTDKIARLATPLEGAHIAEVGPGPGGLTRALLSNLAESVTVIEMDERFLPALADIGRVSNDRLSIVKGDALRFNIAENLPAPRKIIANLPYNVGTRMLLNWVTATPLFWDQMVLMFQKEVAERVCAAPGESAYGRLAVLCQSVAACHIAFDIPARAFTPPPKVDSAVIVMRPLAKEQQYPDLKLLGQVTQAAFGQRRKMLRASLKGFAKQHNIDVLDWIEASNIDPRARPETLPVSAFQSLASTLK